VESRGLAWPLPHPPRVCGDADLTSPHLTRETFASFDQAHGLHGSQWRCIAAQLPGRSDSSVRNRWVRASVE